jgi:hypothetical protein
MARERYGEAPRPAGYVGTSFFFDFILFIIHQKKSKDGNR